MCVCVCVQETVPFERVLGLKVGAMFKKLLEEQGVEFWGNAIVKRFRGRHKAEWSDTHSDTHTHRERERFRERDGSCVCVCLIGRVART